MKKGIKLFVAFLLIITAFAACNKTPKEEEFILNGSITGLVNGKVVLMNNSKGTTDTAIVENGKFTFTGNYAEPTELTFLIAGRFGEKVFYAENSIMTLTGHVDKLHKIQITGGEAQAAVDKYNKDYEISRNNHYKHTREIIEKTISTSVERKDELDKATKKFNEEFNEKQLNFIRENPAFIHSLKLVQGQAKWYTFEKKQEMFDLLDPSLANHPIYIELHKSFKERVRVDKFISNASNVSYKLDEKFQGKQHKELVYLGVFKNNNICALKKDGTISIIKATGQNLYSFKSKVNGNPSSIAVDSNDNIYVLSALQEKIVKKNRGKEFVKYVDKEVECTVFNKKGVKQNRFMLPGLITATGARVIGNKLMVSDWKNSIIGIFDSTTGEMASKIGDMRPCCGILDFSVNDKNEILVANLGAFRVQIYDLTGKSKLTFGQRGKLVDDFTGCCNPVSVAYLSNGAIVTVEKGPTRVKIYSKEGAKEITGIEDMVKGCSYIPMTVDSKDNLYLASAEKGLVKCVSVK